MSNETKQHMDWLTTQLRTIAELARDAAELAEKTAEALKREDEPGAQHYYGKYLIERESLRIEFEYLESAKARHARLLTLLCKKCGGLMNTKEECAQCAAKQLSEN